MEKEKIEKIIDSKEVVSFDIFDTLLFRNIYKPTDLFKIMEPGVLEKCGIDNFAELRVKCEADSRNEKNKNETSLDEIYSLIEKRTKKDVGWIKKREIELELEFIDSNPFIKEIFDYAEKKKKKIVLISDMYLPSDVVRKLVKKAGYKDKPVYISCEHHAGKGTMELYEVVRKMEKLDKNTWVHIGDNEYSDYKKAKEFGIEAIIYENIRLKDKLEEPKSIEASIIRGIQNNYLYNGNEVPYWEKFGVLYASPIYYGFTNWLFKLTKDRDNLFFLARDGYIVKKIYDEFKKNEGAKIDTHYLYCSRRIFQLPALLHKTKDEMMDFLVGYTEDYSFDVTVGDTLSSLGLEYQKYQDKMSIFGFDSKDDKINKDNYYQLKKLLKYIYDDIEMNLKEQEKLVLKYLKQEGLCDYNKINIMDVGWGGSLQEAISILTKKDVMGYYFGTIPTKKVDIMSNSLGYVFDEAKPDEYYLEIFNMPMMYEFVFSAPHGTTLGLEQKGKKIVPIVDEDDKGYIEIVNILQDSASQVIKTYLSYSKYLRDISVEDSLRVYSDMIKRRDFEDLRQFLKLTNSALYTNKKSNYIDEFDEDDIYNNYEEFSKKIHRAMWRDSYLVKGIETEEQWRKHKRQFDDFLLRNRITALGKREYIKKGIKDPKKVVKFIKNKVKKS